MRAWSCRGFGPVPPFLRTPRPAFAPGPLPLRGVAPARRARRRFAAPVRRSAPSLRFAPVAGAAPRALPPGSPARAVCAAVRLRGLSLAPLRLGSPSLRCGLPPLWLRSPLLRLGLPAALRVAPPGPPWARPLRLRASGLRRGCSRRGSPSLLSPAIAAPSARAASGAVGSWPRGLRGPLGPLVSASGPGAFWLRARASAGLRCASVRAARVPLRGSLARCCCGGRWVLPWPPPRPCRPRWGLAGSAWPPALGAPAPGPSGLPSSSGCFRFRCPPPSHCTGRIKAKMHGPFRPGLDPPGAGGASGRTGQKQKGTDYHDI